MEAIDQQLFALQLELARATHRAHRHRIRTAMRPLLQEKLRLLQEQTREIEEANSMMEAAVAILESRSEGEK
jgi:N-formylglutamate amidohydrolase